MVLGQSNKLLYFIELALNMIRSGIFFPLLGVGSLCWAMYQSGLTHYVYRLWKSHGCSSVHWSPENFIWSNHDALISQLCALPWLMIKWRALLTLGRGPYLIGGFMSTPNMDMKGFSLPPYTVNACIWQQELWNMSHRSVSLIYHWWLWCVKIWW